MLKINPFDLILGKRIEGSWAGGSIPSIHFPRILMIFLLNRLLQGSFLSASIHLTILMLPFQIYARKALRPLLIF